MVKYYSEYYLAYKHKNNDKIDVNFILWIDNVEKIVESTTSFKLLDLPDENYVVNYENNMTSADMANIVFTHLREEFHLLNL